MKMKEKVVAAYLASKGSKKVIRKRKIKESEYDLCPHCGSEIGEKAVYQNDKGLYFHRACGKPIEFPDPDYTKCSGNFLKLLTPDQLQLREEQFKNKKPEGRVFFFRIRTLGDTDNKHDFGECHPECEYLEWKPNHYGFCNLFKKDLLKFRCSNGSGAIRSSECVSAVEGLI